MRPQLVDASSVTDDSKIATHTEPVGRGRANFIVRLDLAQHGMPGYYEQIWTRTEDERPLGWLRAGWSPAVLAGRLALV